MQKKIRSINFGLLCLAVLFLGYGSLTVTQNTLEGGVEALFAAVGVSVGVAPNQYNTVAEQLAHKEALLKQKEAVLEAKDVALSPVITDTRYGLYSLYVSAALFVLVGFNFYYDVRRRGGRASGTRLADLR